MDDLKIPSAFLVLVSVVALSLSLSGLSFPYSAANKCPKRALMQVKYCQKQKLKMATLLPLANLFMLFM